MSGFAARYALTTLPTVGWNDRAPSGQDAVDPQSILDPALHLREVERRASAFQLFDELGQDARGGRIDVRARLAAATAIAAGRSR